MTKARKALGVLGRSGVEDDEDRVADGGREGGENGDKSGVGWIR